MTSLDAMRMVLKNADVVFHAVQPAYHCWVSEFPVMNKPFLTAAKERNLSVVLADNLYMYGPSASPLTEGSPQQAVDRKGAFRKVMAAEFSHAHAIGDIRFTTGRAANYFGPRGTNTFVGAGVFAQTPRGNPIMWFGDESVPRTTHYLPDVARALVTLAYDPRSYGRAWHLPALPAFSGTELATALADVLKRPVSVQALNLDHMRELAQADPVMAELIDIWYQYDRPFIASSEQFEEYFGPFSVTPLADALGATCQWFAEHEARAS